MPSSTCAVSGLSEILWAKTSDSQSVFTKVVRPVPEAPARAKYARHGQLVSKQPEKRMRYGLTDHHDGELHTLLDLVPSASSSERHCCEDGLFVRRS